MDDKPEGHAEERGVCVFDLAHPKTVVVTKGEGGKNNKLLYIAYA